MIITLLSAYSILINYVHTIKSSSALKFKIIKQHCHCLEDGDTDASNNLRGRCKQSFTH